MYLAKSLNIFVQSTKRIVMNSPCTRVIACLMKEIGIADWSFTWKLHWRKTSTEFHTLRTYIILSMWWFYLFLTCTSICRFFSCPAHGFLSLRCLYLFHTLRTYFYPFDDYICSILCAQICIHLMFILFNCLWNWRPGTRAIKRTTKEHLVGSTCPPSL